MTKLNPRENVYVIPDASELPDGLDRFVFYHCLYDAGFGVGLYYSPDEVNLLPIRATLGAGDGDSDDLLDLYIGMALDSPVIDVTSDGATITLSLEKSGGGDVRFAFSTGVYTLDCTPAATIALTPGTDTVPVKNYIYIPESTKILTVSTSNWPLSEHAPIGTVLCQTAASAQTDGMYSVHAWTDHLASAYNGHIGDLNYWVRQQNATWTSGTLATVGVGAATFDIGVSSGVILQLHQHNFPTFDTATGSEIMIPNQNGTPYDRVGNMVSQLTDAGGSSMSGKYYNLVVWGVVSEDPEDCQIMVNMPTGSYSTEADAQVDIDSTAVYDIPSDFTGVGFLIARLTMKHAVAGNTYSLSLNTDIRGLFPSTGAGSTGSGGSGVTELSELTDVNTAASTANFVLATPDGLAGQYSGRLLVSGDIPAAYDATVVHLAGTEIITGTKTWLASSGHTTLSLQKPTDITQAKISLKNELGFEKWSFGAAGFADDDFFVARYNDAGVFQDTAFLIDNTTGDVQIVNDLAVTGAVTAATYDGVNLTTAGVATNYLDETGNYSTPGGAGNVTASGPPVANQVAIWTTPTDITGNSAFTFDPATNNLLITTGGEIRLYATDDVDYLDILITTASGIIDAHNSASLILQVTGVGLFGCSLNYNYGTVPLLILERPTAVADVAAYGQIWVKTATPNQLWFTNDAGNDIQLTTGAFLGGDTSIYLTTGADLFTWDPTNLYYTVVAHDTSDGYIGTNVGGGDIRFYPEETLSFGVRNTLTFSQVPIFIAESTIAVADIAGYGQIWVKTVTPNELWFTNDAGTDIQLTTGSSAGGATAHVASTYNATTLVDSYKIGGLGAMESQSNWLYLNAYDDFSAGVYCGTTILRTDGQLQVGTLGNFFKVTAAGAVTSASNYNAGGYVRAKTEMKIFSNVAWSTPPLFADPKGTAEINLYGSGGANLLGKIGFLSTAADNSMFYYSLVRGAPTYVAGVSAAGAFVPYMLADPDGDTKIYHSGVETITTSATGATVTGELTSTGGFAGTLGGGTAAQLLHNGVECLETQTGGIYVLDTIAGSNPFIGFYAGPSGPGTRNGFIQFANSALYIRNEVLGTNAIIQSLDLGGFVRTFLNGDPDAGTILNGDTSITFQLANVSHGGFGPDYMYSIVPLIIKERTAAVADLATYGQIWVKNTTPNELWFTDDAGTDFQLGVPGSGDVTASGPPAVNQVAVWTTPTDITGNSAFTFDPATNNLLITTGGEIRLYDTDDVDYLDIKITTASGIIDAHNSSSLILQVTGVGLFGCHLNYNYSTVPLKILELTAADADSAAYGQIWVKTATPNQLWFTNDAGNDIQLTSGSRAGGGQNHELTLGAGLFIYDSGNADYLQITTNTGNSVFYQSGGSSITFQVGAATTRFGVATNYNWNTVPILIQERAAAVADISTYGQLWVRNATPNQLWFTDDAGNDGQVAMKGYSSGGGDTVINSLTDVTCATRDVSNVIAGDVLEIEIWFTILNNSGSSKTVTFTIDFDGLFDCEISTGILAASGSAAHPIFASAILDVRSSALSYMIVRADGDTSTAYSSGTNKTMATGNRRAMTWATSTTDLTGVTTCVLKARSDNATVTQTLRLHDFSIFHRAKTI